VVSFQPEKFVTCNCCGKSILEKCAIEDDGNLLCGDCVVKSTKKEVKQVEQNAAEVRKKEYEQARREVTRKQRQRVVGIFSLCLAIFDGVQAFNYLNRPEPVKSVHVDLSENLDTVRSIIIFALDSYRRGNGGNVPATLDELIPEYLPLKLKPYFKELSYKKISDKEFVLTNDSQE